MPNWELTRSLYKGLPYRLETNLASANADQSGGCQGIDRPVSGRTKQSTDIYSTWIKASKGYFHEQEGMEWLQF